MGYAEALQKGWVELSKLTGNDKFSVRFLTDEYEIDSGAKRISSLSCNMPARERESVILLHYLIQKIKMGSLPSPTGEWIGFRQLEGGDGYYPAFRHRTIDVILRKYGDSPKELVKAAGRVGGRAVDIGDGGVVIEAFESVPVLITVWKGDEELKAGANISFDKSALEIFCTEDIVVMTEIVAHAL